jgi:DMSO/TMAO reductase YedYZ molybdopterin-dependent catalytic subunit
MSTSRRTFMRLAAAGLSSALIPLSSCARPIGESHPTRQFPSPEEPLTRPEDWYIMAIQGAYEADLKGYRLKVGGLCENGLHLSDAALRGDLPASLELITLSCVGNRPGGGLLSSSLFRGVRLVDLMEAARVSKDATGAVFKALDGFLAFQSMEDLRRPESMIAYDMGLSQDSLAPLPIEHGFPARLLTPGLYGYMQPKWLDSITFVDQSGYHEVLRRSVNYAKGKMMLSSGVSYPRHSQVFEGDQEVIGYAFGDGRPIAEVHIRVDDGPWEPVEIVWNRMDDEELPPYLWCLWRYIWKATPGSHILATRATYADGETQISGREFPYSGGSIAEINIDVVETA